MTGSTDERDRCMCGEVVRPHDATEIARTSAADRRTVERGSCRACGLQLVRAEGETWHQIRG